MTQTMKKILVYIIPLCMALSSCDFLGENPGSFASRGDFFKTEQQCISAVNSTFITSGKFSTNSLFTILPSSVGCSCF